MVKNHTRGSNFLNYLVIKTFITGIQLNIHVVYVINSTVKERDKDAQRSSASQAPFAVLGATFVVAVHKNPIVIVCQ